MTPPSPGLYRVTAPDASAPLRQGEILTGVGFFRIDPATLEIAQPRQLSVSHPYAIILTQDCDLEQDHRVRFPEPRASDKLIPCVLFCEVFTAQEVFGRVRTLGSTAWDRIRQNNDVRYHFLQKVEPGCDRLNEGLPEMAIDFKRYFSLPTEEVYQRIVLGGPLRRCVLVSPYLEHLSCRFAHYLSRVGLPEDHVSEPGGARGR